MAPTLLADEPTDAIAGRSSKTASVFAIIGAAALFGTTGTAQALGPATTTAIGVGSVRLLVGAAGLAALALFDRPARGRAWARHLPALLVGGIAVATYQLGWFAGLRRAGVALGTIVGIGSGPVFAGLIHLARERRGLSVAWLLGTLLTVTGAAVLAVRGADGASADVVGLGAMVGAGLSYAVYAQAAKHAMDRGLDATGAMAGMFGIGAVLLAPLLALEPLDWVGTGRGLALALHLGLVTVCLAYWLYGWGLRTLSVPTAVTLTLAEPLTAAVLGVALLDERLGTVGWLGAAAVAAGLVAAGRGEEPGEPPPAGA